MRIHMVTTGNGEEFCGPSDRRVEQYDTHYQVETKKKQKKSVLTCCTNQHTKIQKNYFVLLMNKLVIQQTRLILQLNHTIIRK